MPIIRIILFLLCGIDMVFAADMTRDDAGTHAHGVNIFHKFVSETDIGRNNQEAYRKNWDIEGWIGGDVHKIWLKTEGTYTHHHFEESEFWAMHSYQLSDFWDLQTGMRYDDRPNALGYVTMGINGLAPYWIETEAHLFLSEDGDMTARTRHELDLLWTQKFISQPYIETDFAMQDVAKQEIGAGITDMTFGLQNRYEITKAFAPYVDMRYGRKIGETATIARKHHENVDEFITALGIRLMF